MPQPMTIEKIEELSEYNKKQIRDFSDKIKEKKILFKRHTNSAQRIKLIDIPELEEKLFDSEKALKNCERKGEELLKTSCSDTSKIDISKLQTEIGIREFYELIKRTAQIFETKTITLDLIKKVISMDDEKIKKKIDGLMRSGDLYEVRNGEWQLL